MKALFSSIFVVLFSIMLFQSLSTGSRGEEDGTVATATPTPTYSTDPVPTDEPVKIDRDLNLTNNQRYFEEIVSPESVNILLMGTDPTGFNFDTITVLNVDEEAKKAKIISFPRDIYIDYSEDVINKLKKSKPALLSEKGINRINAAPSIGDAIDYKKGTGRFNKPYVDFLADLLQEVFGIRVNDYVYVKTSGFRKIVDYFGGVTVYVPVLMNYSDPSQNFEVYIEKGTRHLNGKQAEGYVRFRQGYDENGKFHNYGDIFRKENQTRFIKAFISQHVTLKNLTKLGDIAEIISSNVITSVKGWNNIVEYGALAERALRDNYPIESYELQVTEKNIKGSSYVLIKTEEK